MNCPSSPPPVVTRTPIKVVVDRPIQTVGRRKEAVVRVRLIAGTGQFTLNGRTMDSYFPNKVHQQLIKEPLVTLDKAARPVHCVWPSRVR